MVVDAYACNKETNVYVECRGHNTRLVAYILVLVVRKIMCLKMMIGIVHMINY